MEKELDPEVIKATQNSLGKYVKRPPLSEKLLKKPPFRFLHDIVTTVLKTTGFFEGLFDPEELISDNVKDRDSKILFLNKVVSVLGTTTGQTLSVKPSKIVAGQEPEKTNQLLQCLAQTLDKKLSSDEAVKKYKEGSELPTPVAKKSKEQSKPVTKDTTDVKKLTTNSNERPRNHKRDTSERSLTRTDSKDKTNVSKIVRQKENSSNIKKKESPHNKLIQESKHNTTKKNKVEKPQDQVETVKQQNENNVAAIISENEKNTNDDKEDEDSRLPQENKNFMDSTIIFPKIEPKLEDNKKEAFDASYTIAENDLNSSLSSQDLMEVKNDKPEVNNVFETNIDLSVSTKKKSVEDKQYNTSKILDEEGNKVGVISNDKANVIIEQRKLKSFSSFGSNNSESESVAKNTEDSNQDNVKKSTVRPTSVRPSSSRPGAPRLREKHENVLNSTDNLLIGKVNIIVEHGHNEEEEDTSIVIVEQSNPQVPLDQDELQLSSTRHGHLVQQILDSQKEFSKKAGKTEIEWQFGAQKAREALNQEIEQLRFNIQGLSRAANPLGKLLDHIQEDVEVMRQELQQWTTSYEEASKELVKQKTVNEDSLIPLHTKLKQLNADIEEKTDKINDLKIVIHKNSSRIEKLLASGNVQ